MFLHTLLGSESKWSGERKKQKVIRDPLEETKRQHIAWEMSLTNLKDNNELYYWTCSDRLLASQSASHLLHIQFPPNSSIINNLIAYSPLDQVFFLKPIGELYWSDNVVTSFTSTFWMKLGGSSMWHPASPRSGPLTSGCFLGHRLSSLVRTREKLPGRSPIPKFLRAKHA